MGHGYTHAWDWAIGYAIMAVLFLFAPYITEASEGH